MSAHFWWATAHTRADHSMQKSLRDSMRRTVLIAYMSVISMSQSHTHLTSHEWTLNSLCSRPLVRWYTRTEPLLVPIKTTGDTSANLAGESFPPKSFVKFTFYKRIQTTHLKTSEREAKSISFGIKMGSNPIHSETLLNFRDIFSLKDF